MTRRPPWFFVCCDIVIFLLAYTSLGWHEHPSIYERVFVVLANVIATLTMAATRYDLWRKSFYLQPWWYWLLSYDEVRFKGSLYMRRWRVIDNWLFGIRVHNMVRSDADRDLHDHPFDFVSIILKGGYFEYGPCLNPYHDSNCATGIDHGAPAILFRSAKRLHRIELYTDYRTKEEKPNWSLVLRGPRRRTWGFQTKEGWKSDEQYKASHA